MLSAVGLTRQFGARTVVDSLNLDVGGSEIVALLGPNGAGKTTTLRMFAGLIAPTRGSIAIDGEPLTPSSATRLRERIGFLTETPGLWDRLTVRENLKIYAGLYGLAQIDRVVDRTVETFDLRHRIDVRAAELSKGQRQRVAIARASLHDPRVLLFDEPTAGLDPEVARSVRQLLNERRSAGCAILVSTHNLDEAEKIADRVAVLDRRLLALDRPVRLRERLTTGRVIVRLAGDATPFLQIARMFDRDADATESTIHLTSLTGDRGTASLVRALVQAGAEIVEVRPEIPPLEEAYLRLVGGDSPRIRSGS